MDSIANMLVNEEARLDFTQETNTIYMKIHRMAGYTQLPSDSQLPSNSQTGYEHLPLDLKTKVENVVLLPHQFSLARLECQQPYLLTLSSWACMWFQLGPVKTEPKDFYVRISFPPDHHHHHHHHRQKNKAPEAEQAQSQIIWILPIKSDGAAAREIFNNSYGKLKGPKKKKVCKRQARQTLCNNLTELRKST